jgi:hypothetical protein
MKDCFGATPKPARETRAPPRSTLATFASRAKKSRNAKTENKHGKRRHFGLDEAEVKRVAAELIGN